MRRLLAGVALAGLACGGWNDEALRAELEAARTEALADPGPAPEGFAPDLVLHLSPGLVQRLVDAGFEGGSRFDGKVDAPGGLVLRPDLAVRRAEVAPARGCEACVALDTRLAGMVKYTSGIAGQGEVPLTIDAVVELRLETRALEDGWRVTARPEKVRKLAVEVGGLPKALTQLAEEPLRDFAERRLGDVPPMDVVTVASEDLKVRGFRVEPEGTGVRLAMLSDAVHPGTVPAEGKAEGDWTLVASPESLVWLGRREAFRAGPQTDLEVVGVPERLLLDGDGFRLDLRLWRADPCWWRDYRATGRVAVEHGRIRLLPEDAEETGASPGAALADPLAFLAGGFVTDGIVRALEQSVPASERQRGATVRVERVTGTSGGVAVSGTLELRPR